MVAVKARRDRVERAGEAQDERSLEQVDGHEGGEAVEVGPEVRGGEVHGGPTLARRLCDSNAPRPIVNHVDDRQLGPELTGISGCPEQG